MTEELYNPSVYKEEVVELNLSNEEEPTTEVVPERIEVYDNLTIEELTDKLNRTLHQIYQVKENHLLSIQ